MSGKGEVSREEYARLDREVRENRVRLQKLYEETLRELAAKHPVSPVGNKWVRGAVAFLRRDPKPQWRDGYEEWDFDQTVADALEWAYLRRPGLTKQRRLEHAQERRDAYRKLIDLVATRDGISRTKARETVSDEFNYKDPETLGRFLRQRGPAQKPSKPFSRPIRRK